MLAHGQNIDLKKVWPPGVKRGEKAVVTFTGAKAETATGLWASFPAVAKKAGSGKSGEVQFEITCFENVPLGIRAVQLYGPAGASGWELLVIDDLPVENSGGKNQKQNDSQAIIPPIAIDSRTREDSADYYHFRAEEGDVFSIEVVAHRIGSAMDPVVIVMNDRGRDLFFSDDADASKDTRFRFTAPRTGAYYLQVRDIGFAGGENYFYRLRVGDFPLVSFALPRRSGGKEYAGPHVERGQLTQRHSGLMPSVPEFGSGVVDEERADSEASVAEVPGSIYGKFDIPGDHDHYRFQANEGERLVFASRTRSFGSPCDAMLKILTLEGEMVAEANPTGPNEIALTNKFVRSGEYILQVQELAGGGGPNLAYRIDLHKFTGGFTLVCDNPFPEAVSGGFAMLKVNGTRFDYDGPIELSLVGAGEGIRLENNVIAEKKNEAELKIVLSDEWEPGQAVRFKIEGQGRGTPAALVSTTPALKKRWPLMLYPPNGLDGLFSLTVKN